MYDCCNYYHNTLRCSKLECNVDEIILLFLLALVHALVVSSPSAIEETGAEVESRQGLGCYAV
jgi:hypothetical protein